MMRWWKMRRGREKEKTLEKKIQQRPVQSNHVGDTASVLIFTPLKIVKQKFL